MAEDVAVEPLIVERATQADLEDVWKLHRDVFDDPEARSSVADAVGAGECWVARSGVMVVGFATFGVFLHGHGFLRVIGVLPGFRRHGVARAIVEHLESICPTDRLFTATTAANITMQRTAEALGFVRSGVLEHVEDDDVELVYVRFLGPEDA
jgi:ribosomal protein S18 acetylase RimI-like enzyme